MENRVRLPRPSLYQLHSLRPNTLERQQITSGGPSLPFHSHGLTGLTMMPFIKFTPQIRFRELAQGLGRIRKPTGFYQSRRIDSANERPNSAIVIMMRLICRVIVVAP